MRCRWCKEPLQWHRLLGVVIDAPSWHRVFSGKGRELKPSDGMAFPLTRLELLDRGLDS